VRLHVPLPSDAFQPGDPIAVDVFPGRVVTHVGLVSHVPTGRDAGRDAGGAAGGVRVISASARRGGVFEEPLADFAQGGRPYRPAIARFVPRGEALARARSFLGHRYRLFTGNCEHLVYGCLGHPRSSPQLTAWLRGAAAAAVGAVAVAGATILARTRRNA